MVILNFKLIQMKQCKICNKTKPLESFHKNKPSKDGYRNECKECKSKIDRKLPIQEIVAYEFYE